MMIRRFLSIFHLTFVLLSCAHAQNHESRPLPLESIVPLKNDLISFLTERESMETLVSPDNRYMGVAYQAMHPSISWPSNEQVTVAGLSFDPVYRLNEDRRSWLRFSVIDLRSRRVIPIGKQLGHVIIDGKWSPDSRRLALTCLDAGELVLIIYDIASESWIKVNRFPMKAVVRNGDFIRWLDSDRIVYMTFDADATEDEQSQPIVQVANGVPKSRRYYNNTLKTARDRVHLRQALQSRLVLVDLSGRNEILPIRGLFLRIQPSPDGTRLLTERLSEDFRYNIPYLRFPRLIEVYQLDGQVSLLESRPAIDRLREDDELPPTFKRFLSWHATHPHTLVWLSSPEQASENLIMSWNLDEAQAKVLHGSRVIIQNLLTLPDGSIVFRTKTGYHMIPRGGKQVLALAVPTECRSFDVIAGIEAPGIPGLCRTSRDLIHIGYFDQTRQFLRKVSRPYAKQELLAFDQDHIVWSQSTGLFDKDVVALQADRQEDDVLARQRGESWPMEGDTRTLSCRRNDGLEIFFRAHLPANRQLASPDGTLPLVVQLYPTEHESEAAFHAEVRAAFKMPHDYSFRNHLVRSGFAFVEWLPTPWIRKLKGSALEQFDASMACAHRAFSESNVFDMQRVGVIGHSYGAAAVVSLLTRSHVYKAGIAKSGAYNRTLTPFGFQKTDETLWSDPRRFLDQSPLLSIQQLTTPLMLIHGIKDSNPGTDPQQSRLLFEAMDYLGKQGELILLEKEDHNYRYRENLSLVYQKELEWFKRHLTVRKE